MVCAQLVAYGKVSQSREERKERRDKRRLEKEIQTDLESEVEYGGDNNDKEGYRVGNGTAAHGKDGNGSAVYGKDGNRKPASFIREDSQSTESTEEEIIL